MPLLDVMSRREARVRLGISERRALPRYYCIRRPIIRFLVRPSFESHRAFLHDISQGGLRIAFKGHIEPGTVIAVQLRSIDAGVSLILTARVKHATQEKDSGWILGCSLSRKLSDDELFSLL